MPFTFSFTVPMLGAKKAAPTTPPIITDAYHHWDSTSWVLAAGLVAQVNDQIGFNPTPLVPDFGNLVVSTYAGRDYWTGVSGAPGKGLIGVPPGTDGNYRTGAIICVMEAVPATFGRFCLWGNGAAFINSLTSNVFGNLILDIGGSTFDAGPLAAGRHVIGATWDLLPASGSRKYRVWTEAGLLLSSDTSTASVAVTTVYDSTGGAAMGYANNACAALSIGTSFLPDAAMAVQMANFKAFWQP